MNYEDGMKMHCRYGLSVIEQDLYDISQHFSEACIPGQWSPDAYTDKLLSN